MHEYNPEQTSSAAFIVAEAGTSHDGDLQKGYDLIKAAAEAGADCIKFQIVYADEIIHPKTGTVPLPGGDIPLYDVFKKLEQPPEFYSILNEYAVKTGIRFLCTPFGIKSARILRDMGARMIKIASPELNHIPLLQEVAAYRASLVLSAGVAKLEDIELALDTLCTGEPGLSPGDITLLHCITAYPAPPEEYNLRLIPNLRRMFGVAVGVSDHSADPVLVPVISVLLGAAVIEKHICLHRTDQGLDDLIALEPADFRIMTDQIRGAEVLLHEQGYEALRKELERRFGRDSVEKILGDGVKKLAPAEAVNYGRSNRSIHARTDIPPGESLTEANTAVLRTEKILTPGLHPKWYSGLLGKKTARFIPAGEGIVWNSLLHS